MAYDRTVDAAGQQTSVGSDPLVPYSLRRDIPPGMTMNRRRPFLGLAHLIHTLLCTVDSLIYRFAKICPIL